MKTWCVTDAGGELLATIHSAFDQLPKALPWIEPSINCLHQESVLSLLVGNYECAIMSMCSLLEHVLRLAILNKNECGLRRPETMTQIDRFNSLSEIINKAVKKDVFSGCNEAWWRAVSSIIRNKSAHYLLPTILRNCASNSSLKKYIRDVELPENNDELFYERYITDWGAFYHSAGRRLALAFLNDATEQLRIVIGNTNWSGDESWWISLKQSYDNFFSYYWTVENIKHSFEEAYRERHKAKDE